jgi:serine/threonine protein kinase
MSRAWGQQQCVGPLSLRVQWVGPMETMHPGEVFAHRYRILGVLGQGTFGTVYAAAHVSGSRRVAVKILHTHMARTATTRERLLREAQVLMGIANPHVVQMLDFGVTQEGVPFAVFQFLDGLTLRQLMRVRSPLTWRQAALFTSQILEGLAAVHASGVVHRDVKPENVMICGHVAKLVDFGVAFLPQQAQARLTSAGQALGTPRYSAPEQIVGAAVDARADVYSMGLVFGEMLTGHKLIPGTTAGEVVAAQLSLDPPRLPLPWRDDAFGAVVFRAAAKRPCDRYPSAEAMRADLLRACERTGARLPSLTLALTAAPAAATMPLPQQEQLDSWDIEPTTPWRRTAPVR